MCQSKLRRTIMLVDDSEIDRSIYKRYLQSDSKYEYTVAEAETGEEGFELYQQYQPDLILLDYLLPDVDGIEWLKQLQQQYASLCPTIVLTGQGDETIAVQFIKMGAVDYLLKGQITSEKLKLSVNREISLQDLQIEKQTFANTVRSQNEKLNEVNQLLQKQTDRWEVSQRLIRSSEERLRLAIDYAPIPMVIHAEGGEILQISQTWTELTGYTIEDIPTIADWIQRAYKKNSDRTNVNSIIDRLYELNERIDEGEFEIVTKNGATRIWDFSSAPLGKLLDGRRLVISIAKDITKSRQAEIALQLSENLFRNTFEQAAVGIAHVAPDGKWLRANQKLCEIVGYTKQELLSRSFHDITHPDDVDKDIRYVRQILAGTIQTYSIEKRYIHKNGAYIWVNLTVSLVKDINEEPEYFISVTEDIGDRKKLELLLQKSLRRLSNLHRIDKAILAAAKPRRIAQAVIKDIQSLLVCQRTSIVTFDRERETSTILATQGITDDALNSGAQIPLDVWQGIIEQLNTNRSQSYIVVYLSQLPLLAQIAQDIETELNCFIAFPIRSKTDLLGILKIWVKDPQAITTEELTMVEEISAQVAIALEQARLHKKTQNYAIELEAKVAQRTAQIQEINQELKAFTYSISHDLKAPLRAIQGFALALQEDYADDLDELGQEYTSRLIYSAQQMTQLIEDLLTYSRLSRREIQLKPVALSTVVNIVLEQLKLEIARTKAKITVVEPLSTIMGNQVILVQIISNLLSNAIKFVPPNVRPQICIRTEVGSSNNEVNSIDTNIRLWIEDNGIGIKPQHQDRIFGVFERLHGYEAYPGTGIGLAIAKKGIERLGGRLGVESEFNKGSNFWIEGRGKSIIDN